MFHFQDVAEVASVFYDFEEWVPKEVTFGPFCIQYVQQLNLQHSCRRSETY